eukprot:CAMPEP_0172555138 /NCGR_PEP_ID=MMETSP1067-20121228/58120_1 /TAXON_ID=265564 ORGANISM="Thalassiosira punctigera, Strain Tpunct2005C2" /NCGR_SAMPLE_ID=MMETSP1067 /ASSEMBLY_ACC=CAM_ASM_000444 /LENGTH=181 /DNA_ID=CAMNT_0013343647 /DNA_START=100 /DNA_END=645 /DNA_ORIENTATION=-
MPPKPRVKIPVHVFVYTIAFLPGAAYAHYWYKNAPSDEEHEEELRKKYSHIIEQSRDKQAQMTTFLQNMKDPHSDQQKQMNQILLGGRGQKKRLHAVDEKIYGTEEGAKLQQEAQLKAKKGKRKRKNKGSADADGAVGDSGKSDLKSGQQSVSVKGSVAAVAVVGALAVGACFFLGGKRSQ